MDGELTPAQLDALRSANAAVLIVDIRDETSYRRGHVPGSVNVPFHELTGRLEEVEGAKRVVTVCPHGKASVQAARLIGSYEGCADATVESLDGGLDAWVDSYPLERDDEPSNAAADAPF